VIDPSAQKGMPHRRFYGKTGVVIERRGRAYCIAVEAGGKTKKVIARPEHIREYKPVEDLR
jgi:large subunit ribosomal protein L21e